MGRQILLHGGHGEDHEASGGQETYDGEAQRDLASRLAESLGVCPSQVSVLVAGDEGDDVRLLSKYASVAGIPSWILAPPAEGTPPPGEATCVPPQTGSLIRRSAAILAEAVLRHRGAL